jgi:hypothetical protein
MNTEPIRCCEHLSSKTLYYRPDERPGKLHESDVLTYTCLKTVAPVGPDGEVARPLVCQPGRQCFEGDMD